ncbi:MAG: WYL domain-containing protein [Firmicutes bacterium]|nr:WYL domain-containing protein [Bacillota bacterium]
MINPPKKLSILFILEILKRETNAEHRLSQQEIIQILKRDYFMDAERKSIARNINDLIDAGYDIIYDEGYYLNNREFEYSELRLLIDSVLFSKNIPAKQCKSLLKKVTGLTDRHFNARVKHISTMPNTPINNRQIFFTIEILDEAISQGKKVSFWYNEFHTDKKLHRKKESRYVVSPYQIAATNGRYYLICCTDKYDNVAHYRLDHMEGAQIMEEKAKPISEVKGMEHGLDLPKHMAEHIYMFSGESKRVVFRAKLSAVDQIIDWFGTEISFFNETDTTVDVSVRVNESAMFCWLLQYGTSCEVLSPPTLREKVKNAVNEIAKKYEKDPEL